MRTFKDIFIHRSHRDFCGCQTFRFFPDNTSRKSYQLFRKWEQEQRIADIKYGMENRNTHTGHLTSCKGRMHRKYNKHQNAKYNRTDDIK